MFTRFLCLHGYSLLVYLMLPAALLRLWWLGLKIPAYRKRLNERLGFIPCLKPVDIIIHAVSVGEAQAAIPLIKSLLSRKIIVSCVTPSGSQHLQRSLGTYNIQPIYLPYDSPDAVQRFLQRTKPRLLILVETELWPNLLRAARRQGVIIILINARLSAKSQRGYAKIGCLSKFMLQQLEHIAAQTMADKQRFIQLGMPEDKITITGNIKFDLNLPDKNIGLALRRQWGEQRLVWIAASTHEGEEQIMLQLHQDLLRNYPDLILILAVRHPQRFDLIADLCNQFQFRTIRRSSQLQPNANTQVYLLDTIGELMQLFTASDVAVIGGSFKPLGGHNPLEAAAAAIPVIFGPSMFNFAQISQELTIISAAQQVQSVPELKLALKKYLNAAQLRQQAGARGLNYIQQNRGALAATLKLIQQYD